MTLGQSTRLSWTVQVPFGCTGLVVHLAGSTTVAPSHGFVAAFPTAPSTYPLRLREGTQFRDLAKVSVGVTLPQAGGRTVVSINRNDQQWAFLNAIGTPGALVTVQNGVDLDLSGWSNLFIANGVTIQGGRTATEPGARIFTTTSPDILFTMRDDGGGEYGDNVRITGLRIDGGERGIASESAPSSFGIIVHSRRNIELDNNEIYGWRGAAVKVVDPLNRIDLLFHAMTVRVHDNFIHHNQHIGREGYGVSVDDGAYALIERNVFDYNRHAIKAGGDPHTGYLAYRNLVLEHGGIHEYYGPLPYFTHQFDAHGQRSCFPGHLNCGAAGEYFEVRYNSFTGTNGDSVKLRGAPAIGMDVFNNVFSHADLWSSWFDYSALEETTSGMRQWENLLDTEPDVTDPRCDFNGDGVNDVFMATGQTWWFKSGDRHWNYLNTSTARLADITFDNPNFDNRCDVVVNGVVSSGGQGPVERRRSMLLISDVPRFSVWAMNGGVREQQLPTPDVNNLQLRGTGDFDADGLEDILWQNESGDAVLWTMDHLSNTSTATLGQPGPDRWRVEAVADFDGDKVADVLWRHPGGALQIWFKGRDGSEGRRSAPWYARPSWRNGGGTLDPSWQVKGAGDFNGDGRADIVWLHTDGTMSIWYMNGGLFAGESVVAHADDGGAGRWTIQQIADFDNNGRADILWRHVGGGLALWSDGDSTKASWPTWQNAGTPSELAWQVKAAADFDFDGRADIFWQHTDGRTAVWFMQGGRFLADTLSQPVWPTQAIAGVYRAARD